MNTTSDRRVSQTLFTVALASISLVVLGERLSAADSSDSSGDEVTTLQPFEVKDTSNTYQATDAMTATGIATNIIDAPQNINVITENFIKDLHFEFLSQAALYTAGAEVDEFIAYDFNGAGIRLRGFAVTGYNRDGVTRPYLFLTEDISRIEVILGPVSAFYGRSAPGGIVNFITKKPEFIEKGELDATYGSYNYRFLNLDYQTLILPNSKHLALRILAGVERSNEWRQWEYVHKKYVAPKISWKSRVLEVRAAFEYQDAVENLGNNGRTNPQFHLDWAKPPQDAINFYRSKVAANATDAQVITYLQNRWNAAIGTWSTDIQAVRGGLAPPTVTTGDLSSFYPVGRSYNTGGPGDMHTFTDNAFDATAILSPVEWASLRYTYDYFHGYDDEYQAFGFPNGDRTIPFAPRSSVSWNTIAVNSVDLYLTKKIGPVDNKFLAGTQRIWNTTRSGARSFNYSSLAPVVHNGVTLTGQQVALEYNPFIDAPFNVQNILGAVSAPAAPVQNGTFGEYAQWQTDFWDGRIHTQVAARKDKSIGKSFYPATPTYGLNYRVIPGFVLFGNYSKDYVVNGNNVSGPGVLPGEAQLLPATYGVSKDFGVKTNWHDSELTGTVDFYRLDETNVVSTDALKNLLEPRNNTGNPLTAVSFQSATGLWETEGIDASLIWAPRRYNLQLLFVYDYMPVAKIVYDPQWLPGSPQALLQDGRRLSLCAENTYKFWGKYDFSNGLLKGFSVGAGVRYTGATQGGNSAQPTQYVAQNSYTVCDAMASYDISMLKRPIKLTLTVRNALNAVYLQGGNNIFGDPRIIYLNASIAF